MPHILLDRAFGVKSTNLSDQTADHPLSFRDQNVVLYYKVQSFGLDCLRAMTFQPDNCPVLLFS